MGAFQTLNKQYASATKYVVRNPLAGLRFSSRLCPKSHIKWNDKISPVDLINTATLHLSQIPQYTSRPRIVPVHIDYLTPPYRKINLDDRCVVLTADHKPCHLLPFYSVYVSIMCTKCHFRLPLKSRKTFHMLPRWFNIIKTINRILLFKRVSLAKKVRSIIIHTTIQ